MFQELSAGDGAAAVAINTMLPNSIISDPDFLYLFIQGVTRPYLRKWSPFCNLKNFY